MADRNKRILQSSLGKLLGFDDGAEDILEHLLTIDSKDDLSEYLVQLMGGKSRCLDDFVDNVGRFQNGEPLVLADESGGDEAITKEEEKPTARQQQQTKSQSQTKNEAILARRNKQQQGQKSRVPPPKPGANRKSPPPSSRNANAAGNQQQNRQSNATSKETQSSNKAPPASAKAAQSASERVVQKSHPKKGKATKVCGCFGTRHKPLTNCLYCGRISCEVEGYDFCPFCGLMVEEITGSGANDKAWIQKERLLRFDREFARRTEIFDDQADYQQHSAWMTEDEMAEAQDKEEDRQRALRRPKQTMNLAL